MALALFAKMQGPCELKVFVLIPELYEYKINSTYKRAEMLVVLLLIYVNVELSLSVLYACK